MRNIHEAKNNKVIRGQQLVLVMQEMGTPDEVVDRRPGADRSPPPKPKNESGRTVTDPIFERKSFRLVDATKWLLT